MDYRYLGRSALKVSPLCLGAMMFGGETDEATSASLAIGCNTHLWQFDRRVHIALLARQWGDDLLQSKFLPWRMRVR